MLSYEVKKDGYTLGVARGKKKVVDRIKGQLELFHKKADSVRWTTILGVPSCTVKEGTLKTVYTAEVAR